MANLVSRESSGLSKASVLRVIADELLTQMERPFNHPITGEVVSGRQLFVSMLLSAVYNGKVTTMDGREINISGRDWIDAVKWVANHIDGPASQASHIGNVTNIEYNVVFGGIGNIPQSNIVGEDADALDVEFRDYSAEDSDHEPGGYLGDNLPDTDEEHGEEPGVQDDSSGTDSPST